MEHIIKLYYSLRNIKADFERLYFIYQGRNIVECDYNFYIKCNNIVAAIYNINTLIYPWKTVYYYSMNNIFIERFIYRSYYDDNDKNGDNCRYFMLIEFLPLGFKHNINHIHIEYNSNNCIKNIYLEKKNRFSHILNDYYKLYCNTHKIHKINMLIFIISARRNIYKREKLSHEIYYFIYNEFIR